MLFKLFDGSRIRTYDGKPRIDLQSIALTTRPFRNILYMFAGGTGFEPITQKGTSVFKTGALTIQPSAQTIPTPGRT
jgi:hypothetical protein